MPGPASLLACCSNDFVGFSHLHNVLCSLAWGLEYWWVEHGRNHEGPEHSYASNAMGQGAQLGFLTSKHFYRARIWGELWPVSRKGWPGNCWRPPEKLTGSFHHQYILIFPVTSEDSFIFLWQTPSRILTSETYRHIPRNNQGMENTLKSAVTGDLCPPASLVLSEYLFLARHKVCLAFTFQSSDTVPGMWFRQWEPTWWSALHSWG